MDKIIDPQIIDPHLFPHTPFSHLCKKGWFTNHNTNPPFRRISLFLSDVFALKRAGLCPPGLKQTANILRGWVVLTDAQCLSRERFFRGGRCVRESDRVAGVVFDGRRLPGYAEGRDGDSPSTDTVGGKIVSRVPGSRYGTDFRGQPHAINRTRQGAIR